MMSRSDGYFAAVVSFTSVKADSVKVQSNFFCAWLSTAEVAVIGRCAATDVVRSTARSAARCRGCRHRPLFSSRCRPLYGAQCRAIQGLPSSAVVQ
jgi:hypothetical protein